MKRNMFVLAAAVAMIVPGARLLAHHSHASTYFEDKRQTIEGEIVQVQIRNPHSWVQVDTKDEKGQVVRYAIEWAAGTQLNRQGVNGQTLKVGDKVTVTGAPGRNANDHRLEMMVIKRAKDGWTWGTLPGEVVN